MTSRILVRVRLVCLRDLALSISTVRLSVFQVSRTYFQHVERRLDACRVWVSVTEVPTDFLSQSWVIQQVRRTNSKDVPLRILFSHLASFSVLDIHIHIWARERARRERERTFFTKARSTFRDKYSRRTCLSNEHSSLRSWPVFWRSALLRL